MRSYFFLILFLPFSLASADQKIIVDIISEERIIALSQNKSWLRLLHYDHHLLNSTAKSRIDDPGFFFAQNGKYSPADELRETIAAFFQAPGKKIDDHPLCRYPARRQFLLKFLPELQKQFSEVSCTRLEEWLSSLSPRGLSLIYAASYMNNPASSFGHTLLRLDTGEKKRSPLLSYAINYAAATTSTPGFEYAIRGIFGGYRGYFSLAPYYVHLRKYSEIEDRDVWEYKLNFETDEILFLLKHLWELREVQFDYYFFDENCSYQLLSLIEVLRPGLSLTEKFRISAIPANTVRAVVEKQGLLKEAVYRPSEGTLLSWKAKQVSPEIRSRARLIVHSGFTEDVLKGYNASEQSRILELAYDYLSYRERAGFDSSDKIARRRHGVLIARSKIESSSPGVDPPAPPQRPDQGHKTHSISLGFGTESSQQFVELGLQPAYHDLIDPPGGYNLGSAIALLETKLRYGEGEGLRINRFDLLSIHSFSPRDEFRRPFSWYLSTGVRRDTLRENRKKHLSALEGGVGVSRKLSDSGLLYTLIDFGADSGGSLKKGHRVGFGSQSGILQQFGSAGIMQLSGRAVRYEFGDSSTRLNAHLGVSWSLNKKNAVRMTADWERDFDKTQLEALIAWHYYY